MTENKYLSSSENADTKSEILTAVEAHDPLGSNISVKEEVAVKEVVNYEEIEKGVSLTSIWIKEECTSEEEEAEIEDVVDKYVAPTVDTAIKEEVSVDKVSRTQHKIKSESLETSLPCENSSLAKSLVDRKSIEKKVEMNEFNMVNEASKSPSKFVWT